MGYLIFLRDNGCVGDASTLHQSRSIVCCVQARQEHSNKLMTTVGHMWFARFGFPKFALQTQCSWNQLTRFRTSPLLDGS